MKDLIIIGAGDFAREAIWAAERANQAHQQWNILGFVDDNKVGQLIDGYPVLGSVQWLHDYGKEVYATCAIGSGQTRRAIWSSLADCHGLRFASIIDPAAVIGKNCQIGEGAIICAGTVITVSVTLGFNCILNLNCTIGHDAVLEPYCTVQPGSNISGRVHLGSCAQLGTGTKIIQGIQVAADVVLGAGAVVVRDITQAGTYVGVPAVKVH